MNGEEQIRAAVEKLDGQEQIRAAIQRLDVVTARRVMGLLEALIDALPAVASLHRPHIELLREQQKAERKRWLEGA